MIRAVADVNPIVTGNEIRSTNAPNLSSAIINSTIPAKKHNKIAKCGPDIPPRFVCRLVISANRAVGPMVTSLLKINIFMFLSEKNLRDFPKYLHTDNHQVKRKQRLP